MLAAFGGRRISEVRKDPPSKVPIIRFAIRWQNVPDGDAIDAFNSKRAAEAKALAELSPDAEMQNDSPDAAIVTAEIPDDVESADECA